MTLDTTGEIVAACIAIPFVLLIAGGLSCLIFMGMREVRRFGIVDGFPNFCGFLFLGTIIETVCIVALSGMLQSEEGHARTLPVIAWISGLLCAVSALGGIVWMAGARLLALAADWMLAGAFHDAE